MTREDAYFERILLICGFWEGYDEWLGGFLESEEPISGVVLDLVDCGGDMKEVEHVLNLYCLEKPFDEEAAEKRLRLFLRDNYKSGKMSKDEVLAAMYRFSGALPFESKFGGNCAVLSDYYDLVGEKIVDVEKFDVVFADFLENGTHVDTDKMWDVVNH